MKTFEELWLELEHKTKSDDATSGTNKHVKSGIHEVGKKVVEEASEAWMACEHENKERAAEEISQLIYQTQCLMLAAELKLEDIYRKL